MRSFASVAASDEWAVLDDVSDFEFVPDESERIAREARTHTMWASRLCSRSHPWEDEVVLLAWESKKWAWLCLEFWRLYVERAAAANEKAWRNHYRWVASRGRRKVSEAEREAWIENQVRQELETFRADWGLSHGV